MPSLRRFWGKIRHVIKSPEEQHLPDYQKDFLNLFLHICLDTFEDNLNELLNNHQDEICIDKEIQTMNGPCTPLILTLRCHQNKAAMMLLQHGADPNIMFNGRKSALTRSADMNNNMFKFMVECGADIKLALEHDGSAILRRAVNTFNVNRALFCIESGADVNAKNKDGKTSLHSVIRDIKGHLHLDKRKEMCMMLMDHGANPTIPDNDGRSVLDLIPSYLSELEPIMRSPVKSVGKTE